jgi:hypothetical protein
MQRTPRRLALADDGIIDPIAVDIAARGTRTVALTRAERQLAAARILAQGGTPDLISKRLHVSGTTALMLAARCQGVMTHAPAPADDGNAVIAIGLVPQDQTPEAIRDEARERGRALPGPARSYRGFRRARPAGVPTQQAPTGKPDGGPQ